MPSSAQLRCPDSVSDCTAHDLVGTQARCSVFRTIFLLDGLLLLLLLALSHNNGDDGGMKVGASSMCSIAETTLSAP